VVPDPVGELRGDGEFGHRVLTVFAA
jgi:hypothetical protein